MYTDLLINPRRKPKTRSVCPHLWVKIARQNKVGMNRHFQATRASQDACYLMLLTYRLSLNSFLFVLVTFANLTIQYMRIGTLAMLVILLIHQFLVRDVFDCSLE